VVGRIDGSLDEIGILISFLKTWLEFWNVLIRTYGPAMSSDSSLSGFDLNNNLLIALM
jgi:hypothetical protein